MFADHKIATAAGLLGAVVVLGHAMLGPISSLWQLRC